MKVFIALALFIAAASAGIISQPIVGYNTLGFQNVPVVNTLTPVVRHQFLSSPYVSTRVVSPVVGTRVVAPVVAHRVVSSPVVYNRSPVVVSHQRLVTPF